VVFSEALCIHVKNTLRCRVGTISTSFANDNSQPVRIDRLRLVIVEPCVPAFSLVVFAGVVCERDKKRRSKAKAPKRLDNAKAIHVGICQVKKDKIGWPGSNGLNTGWSIGKQGHFAMKADCHLAREADPQQHSEGFHSVFGFVDSKGAHWDRI